MAMLVTLDKYKRAIRDEGTADDVRHTEAIEDASAAAREYCDRDFGDPIATGDKTYFYDGSGILEIDDADAVHSVTIGNGSALTADAYRADYEGPEGSPYSFIWMPPFSAVSGEMGFMYNLDVYLAQNPAYGTVREQEVTVNADFGFPSVPEAVERAVIWIAASFENDPSIGSGGLAAKSVAEIAEAYVQSESVTDEPIPKRARLLLDPWRRHPG